MAITSDETELYNALHREVLDIASAINTARGDLNELRHLAERTSELTRTLDNAYEEVIDAYEEGRDPQWEIPEEDED